MRRNRIGRIALAVFAAGVIAGCRNGMEEVVPPENTPFPFPGRRERCESQANEPADIF